MTKFTILHRGTITKNFFKDQMNWIWLIVLIVIICAGVAQDYIIEKAAERVTTIRQSCVIGHGCLNM